MERAFLDMAPEEIARRVQEAGSAVLGGAVVVRVGRGPSGPGCGRKSTEARKPLPCSCRCAFVDLKTVVVISRTPPESRTPEDEFLLAVIFPGYRQELLVAFAGRRTKTRRSTSLDAPSGIGCRHPPRPGAAICPALGRGTLGLRTYPIPMTAPAPLLHAPGCPPRRLEFGRAITVLDSGNHHPILCELESRTGPPGFWVVKPQDVLSTGNRRDGELNVLSELASSEVCAWSGINTPATGIVRFPPKPVEMYVASVPERWASEVRAVFELNSERLAFCCSFLKPCVDIDPETLKGTRGKAATERWGGALFALDAYIRHDDRRQANPNAGWLGDDDFVALDHGSAFVGIDRPGVRGRELAGHTVPHAPNALRDHIFYRPLQNFGQGVDWRTIAGKLANVSDQEIQTAASQWPTEAGFASWKPKIVEFLSERRTYAIEVVETASTLIKIKPSSRPGHDAG